MASAVVTQTATYERKLHNYMLNGTVYTAYDDCPLVAKRLAQALTSLGMSIMHVVKDTTQEYDETKSPGAQPSQVYQAHVVDPLYNIGIYIDCTTQSSYRQYYGVYYWFRSGLTSDGYILSSAPTVAYCFDGTLHTITKQSVGNMAKYIFPLSSSSSGSGSGSSSGNSNNGTVVGNYATISGFKAANLFTGEESPFGTYGVKDGNYWFLNTPYNTVSYAAHQTTGHTGATPQPSSEKTLLWQSPLYCGGMLYDKINGGRLFSSSNALPVGADFTVDGITLKVLSTTHALELI